MKATAVMVAVVLCLLAGLGLAKKVVKPPVVVPPGVPAVNLSIRVTPPVKATVNWGKTLLGETPIQMKFPKDSGPVDITVRAAGYLPFHTQLNTFGNDSVTVKLVAEAEKKTVFGYKKELPPPPPPPGDGGVAPDAALAAPAPMPAVH